MKEAFWGLLIILLGLFGVVVVNLFQNVTVDNDRIYYLLKETTEAAAYDAIDLTNYRLTGNMRMVEDKFVENFTRRFAENVTIGNYIIAIEDINELPPKMSLRIRSGISSLNGEDFGLLNRVDGIIEAKYNLDELTSFLCKDKTSTECDKIIKKYKTKVTIEESESGENQCKTDITGDELECIPGDLKFIEWTDHNLPTGVCSDETAPKKVIRKAKYKQCECTSSGVKWSDEKTKEVSANPVKSGNQYTYTWTFTTSTDVRAINESISARLRIDICTTSIGIQVPENYKQLKPGVTSSTTFVACPAGGIKVPQDTVFNVRASYVPANAINREVIWTKSNNNINLKWAGESYAKTNPNMRTCVLNDSKNPTNCFSTNVVTAQKVNAGQTVTSNINAKNYRRQNQTATCKVTIWDGVPDKIGCENKTIDYNGTGTMVLTYEPENSTKTDVTWSISSTYATIDSKTGKVTGNNNKSPLEQKVTVTVTSKEDSTKKGTCTLTVKGKPCPTTYPYTSEDAAKNALTCTSTNQIKQSSNNGEGCYKATCVCSGNYPYSSEKAAKDAAKCSADQTLQVSNDGKGCYKYDCKTTPITAGEYTITTSVEGGNGTVSPSGVSGVEKGNNLTVTFSPSSGYTIDTLKIDGSNVSLTESVISSYLKDGYTFSNVSANHTLVVSYNTSGTTTTTEEGRCSVPWANEVVAPDDCAGTTYGEHYTCGAKTCRHISFGQERVTSGPLCGYNSCSSCGAKKCAAAGAAKCSAAGAASCAAAGAASCSAAGYASCSLCGCKFGHYNIFTRKCSQYKSCSKCGYNTNAALCGYNTSATLCGYNANATLCGYNANATLCGYNACDKCSAKTCTVDKEGTGGQCGYKSCWYETDCVKNTEDVTYYGTYTRKITCRNTSGGTHSITNTLYCKIKRTSYYINPGQVAEVRISSSTTSGLAGSC